jgi:hypothetical protein
MNLGAVARKLSLFWEVPIQLITYTAGQILSRGLFSWLKKVMK